MKDISIQMVRCPRCSNEIDIKGGLQEHRCQYCGHSFTLGSKDSHIANNDGGQDEEEYSLEEAQSELDYLFHKISAYKSSKGYADLLKFCSMFKQLAPYNAMLVQIQRPSSRYVLTAKEWWKKYGRIIKDDARPVIILSFQPVSYLFDISDTKAAGAISTPSQQIMEDLKNQYNTTNEVSIERYNTLIENLSSLGIAVKNSLSQDSGRFVKLRLFCESATIRGEICGKRMKDCRGRKKENHHVMTLFW